MNPLLSTNDPLFAKKSENESPKRWAVSKQTATIIAIAAGALTAVAVSFGILSLTGPLGLALALNAGLLAGFCVATVFYFSIPTEEKVPSTVKKVNDFSTRALDQDKPVELKQKLDEADVRHAQALEEQRARHAKALEEQKARHAKNDQIREAQRIAFDAKMQAKREKLAEKMRIAAEEREKVNEASNAKFLAIQADLETKREEVNKKLIEQIEKLEGDPTKKATVDFLKRHLPAGQTKTNQTESVLTQAVSND